MTNQQKRNLIISIASIVGIGCLWGALWGMTHRSYLVYENRVRLIATVSPPQQLVPYGLGGILTICWMRALIRNRSQSDTTFRMNLLPYCVLIALLPVIFAPFFLEGVWFALIAGISLFFMVAESSTMGGRSSRLLEPGGKGSANSFRLATRPPSSVKSERDLPRCGGRACREPGFSSHVFLSLGSNKESLRVPLLLVVAASCLLFVCLYSFQQQQFELLRIGRQDIDNLYLRIRHTGLGRGFLEALPEYPRFFDHFNPAMAILVPVWWLLPNVTMTFFVNAVGLAATGVMVYRYACRTTDNRWLACGIAVVALLHPSLSQMGYNFSYGIQVNSIALPLLIGSVSYWEEGKYGRFAAVALCVCLLKETHATFYIGMGVVEALLGVMGRARRAPGLLLAITASAYLIVVVIAVLPRFPGSEITYSVSLFSEYGQTPGAILQYLVTHPRIVLEQLFSVRVGNYLLLILGPMALLPLFNVRRLLYGWLSLIGTIFMGYDDMLRICFWHQVDFLAAALLALPYGFRAVSDGLSKTSVETGNEDAPIRQPTDGATTSSPVRLRLHGVATVRRLTDCRALVRVIRPFRLTASKRTPNMQLALAVATIAVAMACASAYGLLPFSKDTLPDSMQGPVTELYRQGARKIHDLATALPPDAKILVSDRASTAFLNFDRLTSVSQFRRVGDGEFDVVVLDFIDTGWSHNLAGLQGVLFHFLNSGKYQAFRYDAIVILLATDEMHRLAHLLL